MRKKTQLTFGTSLDAARPRDFARLAKRAEELGYDMVGSGEHLSRGPDKPADHWSIPAIAVAAGATERIKLVAGIVMAPLHHPVVLAKETALLDAASGGRLILGIGVGGEFPPEYEAVGVPVKERGSRTDETLVILRRLWKESRVSHQGRHFAFRDLTILPRTVQEPHPPIWVGGRREPAMRRAARFGDGWFPYMFTPERYRQSVEQIRELAAQEARDMAAFSWAILLHTCVDSSSERAVEQAIQFLQARYLLPGDIEALVRRACLVGSPEEIAYRMNEYAEAGVESFYINWACPEEEIEEKMELLAQEVLPKVHPL